MPAAGSTVTVVFRKYDGTLHWHYPMAVLGEDDHGLWLGAAAGTPLRRGDDPARPAAGAFVTLAAPGAWSMPIWNTAGRWASYVDICTPVEVTEGKVEAIDLDLDVVATWEGRVSVLDEDEFAEHTRRFRYPREIVERARLETRAVTRLLEDGSEPYRTVGASWRALVGRPNLPSFDTNHMEDR